MERAFDGYRTYTGRTNTEGQSTLGVFLAFRENNVESQEELHSHPPLVAVNSDDREQVSSLFRDESFMSAVCRFLNTGGDWERLSALLQRLYPLTQRRLSLHATHSLYATTVHDGVRRHIFRSLEDPEMGLVWAEDAFAEELPMSEIVDMLQAEDMVYEMELERYVG